MTQRLMGGLTALLMMTTITVQAEERTNPGKPVAVTFDSQTGCWPAYGWQASKNVNFSFKVKKPGTFVFVQMVTPVGIQDDGGPTAGRNVTVSLMDKGRWVSNLDTSLYDKTQTSIIGKAMATGPYEVGFGPTAVWGSLALVRMCVSMENSFPAMPYALPQIQ